MYFRSVYPSAQSGVSSQSKQLVFDKVFDQRSRQQDIYRGADVDTMIKNVIDGFHSTIFCYGQTGSGKTYTMDGYQYRKSEKGVFLPVIDDKNTKSGEQHGLIQRSIK